MAFVNLSLLAGGLLVAIPVILHLVLRQQPKRITFPAVRFLKERRESNRRQLQLRHWILLLLRCAAIGLLAVALARPSVASIALGNWLLVSLLAVLALIVGLLAAFSALQRRGKWLVIGLSAVAAVMTIGATALLAATLTSAAPRVLSDQQAPSIAAVLAFDTSPRMEYRFHNQSRLELAKETGQWLLSQFPAESKIAVLESRPAPPFFCVDLAAARRGHRPPAWRAPARCRSPAGSSKRGSGRLSVPVSPKSLTSSGERWTQWAS